MYCDTYEVFWSGRLCPSATLWIAVLFTCLGRLLCQYSFQCCLFPAWPVWLMWKCTLQVLGSSKYTSWGSGRHLERMPHYVLFVSYSLKRMNSVSLKFWDHSYHLDKYKKRKEVCSIKAKSKIFYYQIENIVTKEKFEQAIPNYT